MMRKLWPTVEHHPDESPASFLSRLAAVNGVHARALCRDIGLSFQAVIDGCGSALQQLADLASGAFSSLIAAAIKKTDDGYRYRGEELISSSLRRSRVMVCPLCLIDDIAINKKARPYGRSSWLIEPLRTCTVHNIALVEAANITKSNEAHDFVCNIKSALPDLLKIGQTATVRPPSSLELYLKTRFDRDQSSSSTLWLDSLKWYVAEDVCSVLGAVALHGRNAGLRRLTDEDWFQAGAAGFDIAKHGEAGVFAFLTEVVRLPMSSQMPGGPQAQLGTLFKWLSFQRPDPAFEPVRELFAQHAIESFPLAAGDLIFGRTIAQRTMHSVHTASIDYKIHPKRLRKIVFATGIAPNALKTETNDRIVFSVEASREILEKSTDSLNLTDAESYLNAGRVHARLLHEEGFITPFVVFPSLRKSEYNFAVKDLDRFLTELLAGTESVEGAALDEYDIPSAAKRANCSAAEIVRLILDKKLSWVGQLAGNQGYLSVLVRLSEIKTFVHGRPVDGFTPRDLERELGTTTATVKALIGNGILPTETIVHPVNRCPTTIIKTTVVGNFKRQYISLFNLAAEQGQHFRKVQKDLDKKGIKPVLTRDRYGASFYRRSDLG